MEGIANQSKTVNRKIVLASRPKGEPVKDNFRIETSPIPEVPEGHVLLRTVYLSLDPYMRGRMNDSQSYAPGVKLGEVMVGGAVAVVEQSNNNSDFKVGDYVVSYGGWQDYVVSNGKGLTKLSGVALEHPSYALGVLGMPGWTAFTGLLYIGEPKAGETVVVSAASGAVGSVVGQIAKIKGCHVVGIAGGPEKCKYVTENFGFDACIDHKAPDMAEQLKNACPKGIDVYFENVGGKVFDAILPLMNTKGRIPMCGVVSSYNATSLPEGPNRLPLLQGALIQKRLRVEGFIVSLDFGHKFMEFYKEVSQWVAEGKIKYLEDVVNGFENTIDSFIGLLQGKNFGKLVIKF